MAHLQEEKEELARYLLNNFSFSREEAEATVSRFEVKNLDKGMFFLKEGQYCKSVAVVSSGGFVFYEIVNGEEKVSNFAFEWEWISNYKSVMKKEPSEFYVKALKKTVICEITFDHLEALSSEVPKILSLRADLAEQHFVKTNERAANLSNLSAKDRYFKEIAVNPNLAQNVPQYYLASYLGIKPQSLSRIRAEIK